LQQHFERRTIAQPVPFSSSTEFLLSNSDPSLSHPEPGRIARPSKAVDQSGWSRWLPGLRTLREYESAWLRHDIVAGLVLTTMLVPVGIAYAVASGLPGINGLYASIARAPCLRAVRTQPDPGAGSGLLARGHHSRRRSAAVGGDPLRATALAA
jgi:hypothetical protein